MVMMCCFIWEEKEANILIHIQTFHEHDLNLFQISQTAYINIVIICFCNMLKHI